MVQVDGNHKNEDSTVLGADHQNDPKLGLKQVEFNTYSVAGGAHSNRTVEMHQYVGSLSIQL